MLESVATLHVQKETEPPSGEVKPELRRAGGKKTVLVSIHRLELPNKIQGTGLKTMSDLGTKLF